MAVAPTIITKVIPIPGQPNRYHMNVSLSATGDLTGGTITGSLTLPSIQPNDLLTLIRVETASDAQATDMATGYFVSDHWSGIYSGIAGEARQFMTIPASDWLVAEGRLHANAWKHIIPLPLFLGQRLTDSPTVTWIHDPNTNTKFYRLWLEFILDRLP